MTPTEEMKARQLQADRELTLARKLAHDEVAGLMAEANLIAANLDVVNGGELKDGIVTLKAQVSRVETSVANVLAAVRRRRTCF